MLIVEAPLDAYDISIGTHCIGVRTNENVEKDTNGFYHIYKKGLFFGDIDMKLEFICKGSELTEEIASELVKMTWIDDNKNLCRYKNYNLEGNGSLISPKKSFISAVESKGFHWLENLLCEEKPKCYNLPLFKIEKRDNKLLKWQEAEEKTFRNPLIFVKK